MQWHPCFSGAAAGTILQLPAQASWGKCESGAGVGIEVEPEVQARASRAGKTAILIGVMMGTALAALDSSIVGTAMPTIVGQLGGLALYPWVFSGYLLTSTTTVPLYGRLADLYGRKRVFFVSAVLFVIGSALCGLAQSMPQLVAFRALQGLGAGGIVPVTLTILGDIYELEERARVQGYTSAVWGVSAVAGPAVGGFITDWLNWRWIFYINVPFGVAAVLLIGLTLHERITRRPHQIDYLGALVLTAGVTLALLGLLQAGETSWRSPVVIGGLLSGIVLLILFVVIEARVPEPILPLALFRRRLVSTVFWGSIFIGAGMFAVSSYLPLYVQGVLSGTAITAALVVAPYSIGWSVAAPTAGRVILRFGFRASVVAGMVALLVAGLVLQLVPLTRALALAVAAAALFGIGMGLSSTAFIIAVQNAVGWEERGIVTALVGFSRTIGGAVGVAALGTVLTTTMARRLTGLQLNHVSANALLDPSLRAALSPGQLAALRDALSAGLAGVYLGILGLVVVAVVLVLAGFPRHPLPAQPAEQRDVTIMDAR